eukprot:COSAG01_NODE_9816_length_2333_cov_19.949013_3_plen_98_part_00
MRTGFATARWRARSATVVVPLMAEAAELLSAAAEVLKVMRAHEPTLPPEVVIPAAPAQFGTRSFLRTVTDETCNNRPVYSQVLRTPTRFPKLESTHT